MCDGDRVPGEARGGHCSRVGPLRHGRPRAATRASAKHSGGSGYGVFYAKNWVSGTGGGICGPADGGGLLLAPTGKARVRMQSAIRRPAHTVAQLLVKSGRYEPDTGRYQRSDHDRISGYGSVIIDECSMLTEDQLDAVLGALEQVFGTRNAGH